jgi:hypothetical protein
LGQYHLLFSAYITGSPLNRQAFPTDMLAKTEEYALGMFAAPVRHGDKSVLTRKLNRGQVQLVKTIARVPSVLRGNRQDAGCPDVGCIIIKRNVCGV